MEPEQELSSLLAEYDAAHEQTDQQPQDQQPQDQQTPDGSPPDLIDQFYNETELNQRFSEIEREHGLIREARFAEMEQADYKWSVDTARDYLKETYPELPDGMLERYLKSEALVNRKLNDAWNTRYQDPQRLEKRLRQAVDQYAREFSNMPDPKLTSDRNLVTAAMKAASSARVRYDEAPDFSRMDKKQLDDYLVRHG